MSVSYKKKTDLNINLGFILSYINLSGADTFLPIFQFLSFFHGTTLSLCTYDPHLNLV